MNRKWKKTSIWNGEDMMNGVGGFSTAALTRGHVLHPGSIPDRGLACDRWRLRGMTDGPELPLVFSVRAFC
ncbi:uncharacterized protein LY79DRAFT_664693 [Colletotrichum navitas]|uniref:Uncharacterized protein n=1 Tax=Colletotrichum navitas TaxID=681940 RepID=A0AAD8QDI1_9PEZI|nr:uncharacterized protein LY79DRAFT_664693 [Colletotrichum navitas]KAK1600400.1 hypothetical protein LY79DRAFT_664693 [Colletotrichum navitas]